MSNVTPNPPGTELTYNELIKLLSDKIEWRNEQPTTFWPAEKLAVIEKDRPWAYVDNIVYPREIWVRRRDAARALTSFERIVDGSSVGFVPPMEVMAFQKAQAEQEA